MSERYARVVRFVTEHPWAIIPSALEAVVEVLQRRLEGRRLSPDEIAAQIGIRAPRPTTEAGGAVAVLPLFGILAHRMNMVDDISGPGGTSTEAFTGLFRAAVGDTNVSAILLDVDSPGGNVFGIQELGDEIFKARGKKPIVAVANSMAASAAYWIATQADELIVTPSGEVGSIGVLAVHEDRSKRADMMGVRVTYVSAGKYKTEGNPFEPLGDDARAHLQSRVDDYYAAFVKAVARGRGAAIGDVRDGFGQGRMVGARDALELGMADGIGTRDQVVERLASGQSPVATAKAAAREIAVAAQELPPVIDEIAEFRRQLAAREA